MYPSGRRSVAVNQAELFYPSNQKKLSQYEIQNIQNQIFHVRQNLSLTREERKAQIKFLEEQLQPQRPTDAEWKRQQVSLREQAEWNRLPPEEQERQSLAFLNAEMKRRAQKKKSMCEQLGSCSVMGGSRYNRRSKKTRKTRNSKHITHKRRK
jgi:hypothetical protein